MTATNRYTTTGDTRLFVVSVQYIVDLNQIEKQLDAHRAFLEACYAEGFFIASGPKDPRTGGIILARATSQEELLALLNQDPFYQHKMANYEITPFIPTKASDDFRRILEA